jgi:hypothetical protein
MSIQSITVPAGTPIYIPSNATILAVTSSVDGIATSSCADIPTTPQVCYSFLWQTASSNTDFTDAFFDKIIIGNLEWSINAQYENDPSGLPTCNGNEGYELAVVLNNVTNKIWTATYYFNNDCDQGVIISLPNMGVVPQIRIAQGVGTVSTYLNLQGIVSTCVSPDGWTAI